MILHLDNRGTQLSYRTERATAFAGLLKCYVALFIFLVMKSNLWRMCRTA